MSKAHDEYQKSLAEIRLARDQAEVLRDQLAAEYERLQHEDVPAGSPANNNRRSQGHEAMRKAIAAADLALSSIDQALREMERVDELPELPDN